MNTRLLSYCLSSLVLASCSSQTALENRTREKATTNTSTQAVVQEEQATMYDLVAIEELVLEPVPMAKSAATPAQLPHSEIVITADEEDRENYANTELNPIKTTIENPVSTFSTDVDTASYTNARRFLSQGQRPPENSIRVEEFINYFDYHLTSPESLNSPIRIETEITQTPWNTNTKLMRVALQTYRMDFSNLPPLNLVFLLDVSGSMRSPDKLPLMQRSFDLLVKQLRPEDRVAIAVYAGSSGVVLEPTAGDDKVKIRQAIHQLQAGGSTHGSAGLHLAYQLAEQHFDKDSINRIFIGTDGDFNVGTTGIDDLKSLIEDKRKSGVFLSVLGFGTGNYNDYLMEEISNHGNGNAYYIDSYQEARKIFSEQLAATLQTVAKDVKIQVEFNPAQVAEYRLIGYDNRQLNREDFNNDKIDAADMGSGHSATALYEIVLTDSDFRFNDELRYQQKSASDTSEQSDELAFIKVRYKLPDEDTSNKMTLPVTVSHTEPTDAMVLSAAVAGFAESLRNSPYLQDWSIEKAVNDVTTTLEEDHWGYRQELLQLMKNTITIIH